MGERDRGQAVPIVIGVVAVLGAMVVGIGRFAVDLRDAAQARTAADAAALAGVAGGPDAAREMASANGAALVSINEDGDDVIVVVSVGRARASARATDGP
jgi:hypothetical protein